jgi:murein L,D-transpeptidase YafK
MRVVLGIALLAAGALGEAQATSPPELQQLEADLVIIEKGERRMTLYTGGRHLATFEVALGRSPVGPKRCRGDNRTPEGYYHVAGRKENSDFHRALRISYPSPDDVERARAAGCDPGGDIMIHGLKTDMGADSRRHREVDWTQGCVAVTNDEIERIWALVPDGARVEIRP